MGSGCTTQPLLWYKFCFWLLHIIPTEWWKIINFSNKMGFILGMVLVSNVQHLCYSVINMWLFQEFLAPLAYIISTYFIFVFTSNPFYVFFNKHNYNNHQFYSYIILTCILRLPHSFFLDCSSNKSDQEREDIGDINVSSKLRYVPDSGQLHRSVSETAETGLKIQWVGILWLRYLTPSQRDIDISSLSLLVL